MKTLRLATLIAAAALAVPAFAQSNYAQQKGMDERFRIDMGGFFQNFSTTLSLSNKSGSVGTEVNFEDDLGQSANQTSFAADGYWRFGRHGRLDFAYRGWNRSNSHTLTRDIVFGDTTYHVGATLDSRLRVSIAELYYSYSFVNNGDLELGLGLGVSTYFTSAQLDGTGTVSGAGGGVTGARTTEGHSLVAPIPAIRAYGAYTIIPKLFLSASVKGIGATINGYHASMVDGRGGLTYVFSKNIGAGAHYQYVKITFSHEGTSADLAATYRFQGPLVVLVVAF
jgi:hypothetical protein